jgi:hypothetical protein
MAALRAGDRARARELLAAAVRANPHSAQAWLWLSGTLDDPDRQRECLNRALAIDPNNVAAQQGLDALNARVPAPGTRPPAPGTRPPEPGPLPPTPYPPPPRLPPPAITILLSMLGGVGLALTWLSVRKLGTNVYPRELLALALLAGPPLGLVGLLMLGMLLRLAGRSLGGCGDSRAVQAGLSLAAAPQAFGLLLWLAELTFIPAASFGGPGATSGQRLVAVGFGVAHWLLALASAYLALAGVALAHRISLARAASAWLLAVLFVLITMATIFVSSALLITLRGG